MSEFHFQRPFFCAGWIGGSDPAFRDSSAMFSTVRDYLKVEKGWFAPYLYASARRPAIPRSTKSDVIFCHGPFLQGELVDPFGIGRRMFMCSID